MDTTNWHSINQLDITNSGDINQEHVIHTSKLIYGGANFSQPQTTGAFLGWVPLSATGTTSVSQVIGNVSGFSTNGIVLRIPISYSALPSTFAATPTDFSTSADVYVSYGTSTTEVPGEFVNALASDAFQEAQGVLIGNLTPSANPSLPVTLSTTLTQSFTMYLLSSGTMNVTSTAGFPNSSGILTLSAVSQQGQTTSYVQYTGKTATSFTGCNIYSLSPYGSANQEGTYNPGTSVSLTPPASLSYISANGWLFATNTLPSTAATTNATYAAPCYQTGLGQWIRGDDLPEFDCSCVYAPSSQSIFAYGESGTLYSTSFDSTTGAMGAWATVQTTINNVSYVFPFSGTNQPSLCVATIDSTDYLFIIGGSTNSYVWMAIDSATGQIDTVNQVTNGLADQYGNLFNVYQGGIYGPPQTPGNKSYTDNSYIYAVCSDLTIRSLPIWIDINSNFNVGSFWTTVSTTNTAGVPLGLFSDTLVTSYFTYPLSPSGAGSSSFYTSNSNQLTIPWYGSRTSATFYPFQWGAINQNNDGTATLFGALGYYAILYPVTWLNVPLPAGTTSSPYNVTIAIDSDGQTNYGVNVGVSYLALTSAGTGGLDQGIISTQGTYSNSLVTSSPLLVTKPTVFSVQSLAQTYNYYHSVLAMTATTTGITDFVPGQTITLSDFTPSAYNGTYKILYMQNNNVIYIQGLANHGQVTVLGQISSTQYPACINLGYDTVATGSYPTAIFDDSGKKYTYLWWEQPNNLLSTIGTWVEDPNEVFDSSSIIALNYDGIGGQNATSPTLTYTTEIA